MRGTWVDGRPRAVTRLALLLGVLLAALVVGGGAAEEASAKKKGGGSHNYVGAFGASATDSQNEGFAAQTIRMSSYSTEGETACVCASRTCSGTSR